jgi:hypothetical protein
MKEIKLEVTRLAKRIHPRSGRIPVKPPLVIAAFPGLNRIWHPRN